MEKKNTRSVKEQVNKKTRIKLVVMAVFVLLILVIGAIRISNFAKGLGDSHNQMGNYWFEAWGSRFAFAFSPWFFYGNENHS